MGVAAVGLRGFRGGVGVFRGGVGVAGVGVAAVAWAWPRWRGRGRGLKFDCGRAEMRTFCNTPPIYPLGRFTSKM